MDQSNLETTGTSIMQTPQLLPRLVPDLSPKVSRKGIWPLFSSGGAQKEPKKKNHWIDNSTYPFRSKKTMVEQAAREKALKLCPWAFSEKDDSEQWPKIAQNLTKIASMSAKASKVAGDDIKFDFREHEIGEIPGLLDELELLSITDSEDESEVNGTDTNGTTVTTDDTATTNGNATTNGTAVTTNGTEEQDPKMFHTNISLAPTIHTNELVNKESTPFYHSETLSLPTRPPQGSTSSLVLTTVSRPEVRLNCASQTVYSVRNAKAESTTPMQDFTALNNTVNSRGQTIFTEKRDGRYYLWATHHSNKANDPDKYWFYVVRTSFVDPDGELTAVVFAELTPKTGWVYDPDMHYKGHFYLVKVKPMTEKRAFDSNTQANPPRANSLIFVNKLAGHLPMLEFHSGQPFVSYKDPSRNYHLHWVDWERQKLWQICHIKPFQGPGWNAAQTRPIPILFNGGMYLIESSQIIKCYFTYQGDVPRLVSMRRWTYDQPLASKAILWADHLGAKHVVLHHLEGYHIYDLEKKQHYESSINKDRPSLWSLVDGKIHKFGYTQSLLDKIEASVARRKLQAGDRVDF
ncbi:hypothetical protein CJU90_3409 [Yarrowia sp. C11]|nr:hypothetical protein CKK34_4856 [Yarrowia sp. E02]KAG5369870.1 hypothetical protein CJU90_3409 [Yarrowia sp. C11]